MTEIYTVDENGFITVEESESESVEETQSDNVEIPASEEVPENDSLPAGFWPSSDGLIMALPEDAGTPYVPDVSALSADADVLAVGDVFDLSGMVVYTLTLSSYGDCTVVLTPDQAQHVTLEAGQLVNWYSSNITVPLFVGEPKERTAQNTLMLTLLGRGNTGFANNLYRYGSAQYVTSYYVNGSSLSSTNTYVGMSGAEQTGYSLKYWVVVVILVCLIIMAVNGLIRFLRRGIRG